MTAYEKKLMYRALNNCMNMMETILGKQFYDFPEELYNIHAEMNTVCISLMDGHGKPTDEWSFKDDE